MLSIQHSTVLPNLFRCGRSLLAMDFSKISPYHPLTGRSCLLGNFQDLSGTFLWKPDTISSPSQWIPSFEVSIF